CQAGQAGVDYEGAALWAIYNLQSEICNPPKMAYTINGFGTHVCCDDDLGWNSYDAVEWFVAFYLPIVPLKVLHAFDWYGNRFRMVPLKWSSRVVFRTFAHRWCWVFLLIGAVLSVVGGVMIGGKFGLISAVEDGPLPEILLVIGLACLLGFAALFF